MVFFESYGEFLMVLTHYRKSSISIRTTKYAYSTSATSQRIKRALKKALIDVVRFSNVLK